MATGWGHRIRGGGLCSLEPEVALARVAGSLHLRLFKGYPFGIENLVPRLFERESTVGVNRP